MKLARTAPASGSLPNVNTYRCKSCGTVFVEPAEIVRLLPDRAISLHYECCSGRA